ncbi:hypothetical protein H7J77_01755 [Mycolicibacillus parakoreensis]|uniref:Uncharacterized protein n=1 Tax=Mycolicibacillus parakoreensis TaxID=1069221 RepID=A0ABY3TZ56_9MYCO|nr:hypothetical protein [Mycolicibacillus parakoreensis]MCV7314276.1 hypothetical protein [Mycolicibacillus parakoreensis]ULN52985.1 hypothetical protein MIU77_00915 [Mycolicibacillus parakoreensis]HLR98182.1 hypothetical protein [Mycolicibacillus parakoreensis]
MRETAPIGPQPGRAGAGSADPAACNRSYVLAGVRAGIIALGLLVMLTLVVLL